MHAHANGLQMKNRQYNEQGYAFEVNKYLTEYAQDEQLRYGLVLPSLGKEIVVLDVYSNDELVSHMLFDTATQKPIDEASGLAAMAVCIDKHKFIKL